MPTPIESVLHKIVNHLPISPHDKDRLLSEVTAEFGNAPVQEEPANAPE